MLHNFYWEILSQFFLNFNTKFRITKISFYSMIASLILKNLPSHWMGKHWCFLHQLFHFTWETAFIFNKLFPFIFQEIFECLWRQAHLISHSFQTLFIFFPHTAFDPSLLHTAPVCTAFVRYSGNGIWSTLLSLSHSFPKKNFLFYSYSCLAIMTIYS